MKIKHWQDVASLLAGVWLVISPMALSFPQAAAWFTVTLGLTVMVFAIEGLLLPSYLEECAEIVTGVALMIAPWVVAYDSRLAVANSVLVGTAVVFFAISELMTDREFQQWWDARSRRKAA